MAVLLFACFQFFSAMQAGHTLAIATSNLLVSSTITRFLFYHFLFNPLVLRMKKAFVILVLSAMACKSTPEKDPLRMSGAYLMKSVTLSNDKTDTSYTSMLQLKIFTAEHMMYANVNPKDSVSAFGVGTYSIDKDTMTESVFYRASDTTMNDTEGKFRLTIEKTDKGYKQVIPDMDWGNGQKWTLTETYESVGTTVITPLDGLWKISKSFSVNGKDTNMVTGTQFKMYHGGHFMFGHTWVDSTKRLHTGMGYGTFSMEGNNKSKENIQASTYYQIRGQSVDLDIEFNGTDVYTQTITNPDGTKNVETYERVKGK